MIDKTATPSDLFPRRRFDFEKRSTSGFVQIQSGAWRTFVGRLCAMFRHTPGLGEARRIKMKFFRASGPRLEQYCSGFVLTAWAAESPGIRQTREALGAIVEISSGRFKRDRDT
jgi:hypothetical protein